MVDKNGTALKDGDVVSVIGVFKSHGTNKPNSTFVNCTVTVAQLPGTASGLTIFANAKHCEKVPDPVSPPTPPAS